MATKKDYVAIAKAIKVSADIPELVVALCVYFRDDNPNFDAVKFIDACDPSKAKGVIILDPLYKL